LKGRGAKIGGKKKKKLKFGPKRTTVYKNFTEKTSLGEILKTQHREKGNQGGKEHLKETGRSGGPQKEATGSNKRER